MDRSGIVVIDKPAGWSSHKVVQLVKRTLRVRRAGHTGTLDPFATGVLPVCVNEATKAIRFLPEEEKEYVGILLLGVVTDTFDITGTTVAVSPVPAITSDVIESVFSRFTGAISQVPPPFAAVKFQGKPLYHWARKGIRVEKEARSLVIRELTMQHLDLPEIAFRVVCSKGTYVRALAHDIGQHLGCGACLKELRRLRSGPFTIGQAVSLAALHEGDLFPVSDVLSHLPSLEADESLVRSIRQGRTISLDGTAISWSAPIDDASWVKILTNQGELVAIYTLQDNGCDLTPVRVFNGC